MKARVGKIKYSFDETKESSINECHEVFALLKFIPLNVDFTHDGRSLQCVGLSPLFNECEYGSLPPEYEVIVHTKEGVVDSITVNNF